MDAPGLDKLIAACITALTAIVTALGVFAVQYIQERRAALREDRKRKTIDDAVGAVEEEAHAASSPIRGPEKLAMALRLADLQTPSNVIVTPAEVQAGVARRRASLASSSIAPGPAEEP